MCLYDSANDPTFCPAQPSEPTPEEALAQLLTRGQAMTGSVQEPPSHHEDDHECSMDSDMRESMEGLSLSAVLSQQLGPPSRDPAGRGALRQEGINPARSQQAPETRRP